jgi:hypothetical protein
MPGYPNRFRAWFDDCDERREVEELVGFHIDTIDSLKVRKYGNTHYIYEDKKDARR